MMNDADFDRLLGCLARLNDDDDAVVVGRAREASRLLAAHGLDWADLLHRPGSPVRPAPEQVFDHGTIDFDAGDDEAAPSVEAALARLLARADLGEETRAELEEFQADLARGILDSGDARYIVALAGRIASE